MPLVLIFIVEAIPEPFFSSVHFNPRRLPPATPRAQTRQPLRLRSPFENDVQTENCVVVPGACARKTKISEEARIRAASSQLSTSRNDRQTDLRRSTPASVAGRVHPLPGEDLGKQDTHQ